MKLLFAVMASFVALSAQAEFKKCDTDTCKHEIFKMQFAVNDVIRSLGSEAVETTPSGKKIPYSILKELPEPVEVLKSDKAGVTPVIYSPKASCEQLYMLLSSYQASQIITQDTSHDGLVFYLEKIYHKCPSIYAELGKKYGF